jgi:hypothetical protein
VTQTSLIRHDDCWLYAGSINNHDYGVIYLSENGKTKRQMAHRVMYENLVGEIPEGLVIDHLCRVPRCINPAHLEAVSQYENVMRGKFHNMAYCKYGHRFTEANTLVRKDKRRGRSPWKICRTCHNAAARKYMKRLYWQRKKEYAL